ncbi:hypothetical protein RUM43_011913 [Polyplax serrata]|uniref:Uncharacterized protein n=1 Tax=Polyplax serrata TaxID=468196 RepID=A0AAN8S492_POLSC
MYEDHSHLYPYVESDAVTKEFLQKLFEILFMFIQETNDRDMKVLNFKHPEEMFKHLDLEIPEQGKSLQTLLEDCHTTLKNQVRTDERSEHVSYVSSSVLLVYCSLSSLKLVRRTCCG